MKRLDAYWRKWTQHCAAGELLGIGVAGGIAFVVNQTLGEPVSLLEKGIVLGSMVLAGAIEGTLLGWFQWRVLKERIPLLPAREWIEWTVAIAMLGWLLGTLPSLFWIEAPADQASAPEISPVLLALGSIAMGLGLGALFGGFQWMALRKYVTGAGRWIVANALGWGLGLGWIYLAASLPDERTSFPIIVGLGIAGGLLAGLSVGAVTGVYLNALTAESKSTSRAAT
jgi:hypothetical protein